MAKLINFKDLGRNNVLSTAAEHTDIIHKHGSVLWGQFSSSGKNDDISLKAYNEINNHGNGSILYAYDSQSMLLKMKVSRVLTKAEVKDEHLEYLIPSYYGIDMPVHCYFQISEVIAVDPSYAFKLIADASNQPIGNYRLIRINGKNPWNVHELEQEDNELLVPKNIFEPSPKLKALPDAVINLNNKINTTYTVYRVYHKDTVHYPDLQYIGETHDINERIKNHFSPTNYLREKKKYLYIIMRAFGNENFTWQILEENIPSEEEARKQEAYWIEVFHAYYGDHGLNERNERRWLK